MNHTALKHMALMTALLGLWGLATPLAQAEPSVDEMVEALAPKPGQAMRKPGVRTRSFSVEATAPGQTAAAAPPPALDLSILFASGATTLQGGSRETLQKLAQALSSPRLKEARFRIEGHTDSVGGLSYNMFLSEMRAETVRKFLAEQGVDNQRMATFGLGPTQPVNSKEGAAAENRRVRIMALW